MNALTDRLCTVQVPRPFDYLQIRRRVRAEFAEMPGMRVTLEQAMRLWSLNRETCESVIGELMASRFLRRDLYGRYGALTEGIERAAGSIRDECPSSA